MPGIPVFGYTDGKYDVDECAGGMLNADLTFSCGDELYVACPTVGAAAYGEQYIPGTGCFPPVNYSNVMLNFGTDNYLFEEFMLNKVARACLLNNASTNGKLHCCRSLKCQWFPNAPLFVQTRQALENRKR